jgi:hypothetical protein
LSPDPAATIREKLDVQQRSSFRPAESLIAEGNVGGGNDMLAAFAGIGLVFIAVVALGIGAMWYLMVKHA